MSNDVYRITNVPSMVVVEDQKTALADIVAGTGLKLRNRLQKQISDLTALSDDRIDEMISLDLSQSSDGKRPSLSFVRNARRSFQSGPSAAYARRSFQSGGRSSTSARISFESIGPSLASARTPNTNEVDLDEQKRMVEYYEYKKIEEERNQLGKSDDDSEEEASFVDVAPGISLPLRSIKETYRSIVSGKTVSAKCYGCQENLYAVEGVTMIICGDCWLCMPPAIGSDQKPVPESLDPRLEGSVGLGVTDDDIVQWFSKNQDV
eukprot:scaffold3505_cov98-Cylindrotheca_fusiformis.AAC.2